MQDEVAKTGGAITATEVGICNMAKVLLPLVGVAPASLSLPPRKRF